ncbi:uncharacterized protein [Physcomitrium patens]|uniref:Uncharacterized protein n=1 Tax=Physcomitrium patens TaxID=3218 RepID=A0A2K1JE84_PHYPA|nr:uncharacterized protein LOC112292689 [Physcomitrium patens]PNR39842.1 hypothetical protein PHYPA_020122 [Physcomitrium patens]|eukprot:XP_024397202.1 uncharacterized protein LOC112292689 [Physcomitrella patens]
MSRRCSHCGLNGHNSRTCPDRGVRLFGVRLTDGISSMNMRKSVSMNNLSHYTSTHNSPSPSEHSESGAAPDGYVSDGLVQTSNNARERKKGVPWTEDEHRLFLLGLQKLGKGDWRGISRNFVTTRTPTQVASHAQKYFIRQSNMNKRKRRSSLFDIVSTSGVPSIAEESTCMGDEEQTNPLHQLSLGQNRMYPSGVLYEPSSVAGYGVSVGGFAVPKHMSPPMALPLMSVGNAMGMGADGVTEVVGMGYKVEHLARSGMEGAGMSYGMERSGMERGGAGVAVAAGAGLSLGGSAGAGRIPYSFTSSGGGGVGSVSTAQAPGQGQAQQGSSSRGGGSYGANPAIVRPTAKVGGASSAATKMEEDGRDIAQLRLGLSPPEPSQLTAKLLEAPSRHSSAFHVNTSFDGSSIQQGVNAISVV